MEMIGNLRLAREFNVSKSAEKLNGILFQIMANDRDFHAAFRERLRSIETTMV